MKIKTLILASAALLALTLPATAQEGTGKSPWMVRGRFITVAPDESSSTSIGGHVALEEDYLPEVDVTYFLDDHWALELIAATNTHHPDALGTTSGNLDLGKVSLLPPTLTVQYHFLPDQTFRPYVGAGLNYTIFYDEDTTGSSINSIDYDNSVGYALQAGFDVGIDDHWSWNVDVKKLFLSTDVSINGGGVTADVDIDPWIIGTGIGYRF